MPDSSWLQTELTQTLLADVVADIVRRYRIDEGAAAAAVREVFSKSDELHKILGRETSPPKVTRTRAFKDAVNAVRRNIYYDLRRYSADVESQTALIERLSEAGGAAPGELQSLVLGLAESHASTRERLKDREAFYGRLLPLLARPRSILDVGCGMQPLLFPFNDLKDSLELYVAADKDPASVAAVAAFARASGDRRIVATRWDIAEGWPPLIKSCQVKEFDVAFLLKLVPVVERQRPELVDVLRETPGRLWVLTGSKVSLTKRQDIERRERSLLRRFYEASGRRVVDEFSVTEEFCLILE